ncbi:MAG: flagellar hook-basal body complex protein FliE [Clostridiales bacterium]|nr:flagellar hook-basal body complex protein FliE [Clostridiales bacterium]
MSISPISPVSDIGGVVSKKISSPSGIDTFKNMLNDLVNNVNEAEATAAEDIMKIASGEADDLHTIIINSQKAELAVLTAVQIRNKVLDAYKEIMNISL